jgi:hypothetical protein
MYEYEVNGQRYVGNRIRFGDQIGTGFRSIAENAATKYGVGSSVQVFYNPSNPQDAALERNSGGSLSSLIIFGVLIFAAVIVLVSFGGFRLPF